MILFYPVRQVLAINELQWKPGIQLCVCVSQGSLGAGSLPPSHDDWSQEDIERHRRTAAGDDMEGYDQYGNPLHGRSYSSQGGDGAEVSNNPVMRQ